MEKQKSYYEYWEKKGECTYWLTVESCRRCLFETLCRLDQNNKRKL